MPILNSAYFTECRRHIVIPCGKVCRIKNRHTFRILPILKSAYFKSMPILNLSYHAVKYAELRIGSILKVCRFVIRHITQTETQTETEANFTHEGTALLTRMHSIRMRTVCCRGHLSCHACPPPSHACSTLQMSPATHAPSPCMPPAMHPHHTCLPCHAPPPHMPPLPCMPNPSP